MSDAREARGRRLRLALLVLAALAFALVRVPFLSLPLERDEGEYAYIAWRALAGDVPYRDAFDQKPPGIFALYLAAFALFGRSVEGIHAFLYLWTAGTALALHGLVHRAADRDAAAFAVLAFAVISIDPSVTGAAANTEAFLLLPMVASTVWLLRGLASGRGADWVGCGALAAVACWIKPVAATNALFAALFAAGALGVRRTGAPGPLRAAAWIGAGAALASAPFVLVLLAIGAWDAFVDAVVVHNWSYGSRLAWSAGLGNLCFALGLQAPSFWACWGLAAFGLASLRPLGAEPALLLAGFAAASAVGVASGLYFRPHYFVQLFPALCALVGVGAAALLRRGGGAPAPLRVAALATLLVAPPVFANRALLGAPPERISREIYGINPFVESRRIAAYIQRTSEPDDTVYIVGSEPQILFHAERRSATRYIFFYPLTGGFPDALERQRAAMREVRGAEPLYVVWVDLAASLLLGPASERWILEASRDLIEQRYRLEFLARPPKEGAAEFDFVFGSEARALLAAARRTDAPTPWVAVFRRAP